MYKGIYWVKRNKTYPLKYTGAPDKQSSNTSFSTGDDGAVEKTSLNGHGPGHWKSASAELLADTSKESVLAEEFSFRMPMNGCDPPENGRKSFASMSPYSHSSMKSCLPMYGIIGTTVSQLQNRDSILHFGLVQNPDLPSGEAKPLLLSFILVSPTISATKFIIIKFCILSMCINENQFCHTEASCTLCIYAGYFYAHVVL